MSIDIATSYEYEELLSNFLETDVALKNYAEWTIGSVRVEDIYQVEQELL